MKTKLPLEQGRVIASRFVRTIAPGCHRAEEAGSIRRCKPEVGDIEIVCIPKSKQASMFDMVNLSATELDDILAGLLKKQLILPGHANGPKYKSFIAPSSGVQIDLFIVTPPEWGMCFTIRTGSADFSHRLVRQQDIGGMLPFDVETGLGWYVQNNRLHKDGHRRYIQKRLENGEVIQEVEWFGGTPLETPEERDVFELIGLDWVEPQDRLK